MSTNINPDAILDKSITKDKLADGVLPTKVSDLNNDAGYLKASDSVFIVTCAGYYDTMSNTSGITTDKTSEEATTAYMQGKKVIYVDFTLGDEDRKVTYNVQAIGVTIKNVLFIYEYMCKDVFVHSDNKIGRR